MIDLTEVAGVPATVDPRDGRLGVSDDLAVEEWAWRTLDAARDVYVNPPTSASPLYHMANGITRRDRREPESALRFELTSLRPGSVGGEFVKTIGHIHSSAPDGLGYPETYEVIAGRAIFVLFRTEPSVCLLVDAGVGEQFVIPPGWHHLAVNPGKEAMVFADVVARSVLPDYTLLRARNGAPFYLGPNGIQPNPRYPDYRLHRVSVAQLPAPTKHGRLADTFFAERSLLDYLLFPVRYRPAWAPLERLATDALDGEVAQE